MVIENVAGCGSVSWRVWSFGVCRTSGRALLPYRVSIEKLGGILRGPSLYLIFFFGAFDALYFSEHCVWILCAEGNFYFRPVYLVFCVLLDPWWVPLSSVKGHFPPFCLCLFYFSEIWPFIHSVPDFLDIWWHDFFFIWSRYPFLFIISSVPENLSPLSCILLARLACSRF